jgi:hypothetical protein
MVRPRPRPGPWLDRLDIDLIDRRILLWSQRSGARQVQVSGVVRSRRSHDIGRSKPELWRQQQNGQRQLLNAHTRQQATLSNDLS